MVSLSKCLIYFLSGQLKYLLSSCSPQKRQLTSSLVLLTLKLPVPSNDNATQRRRKFWRSFLRRSCSKHWNSGTFFEGFMFMLDHTHTTVSLIDLLISLNEQKELQYILHYRIIKSTNILVEMLLSCLTKYAYIFSLQMELLTSAWYLLWCVNRR